MYWFDNRGLLLCQKGDWLILSPSTVTAFWSSVSPASDFRSITASIRALYFLFKLESANEVLSLALPWKCIRKTSFFHGLSLLILSKYRSKISVCFSSAVPWDSSLQQLSSSVMSCAASHQQGMRVMNWTVAFWDSKLTFLLQLAVL